jgi:ABC-type spermidine/putrescine transport system permease subunit II
VPLAASGSTWLDVMITASIVVPLVVLGIVIWAFFRAAARADREGRA